MNKLYYYNPIIPQNIVHSLLDRIGESQDDSSISPGKYALSSCFRSFPGFVMQKLAYLEKYREGFTESEFVNAAEVFAGNNTCWRKGNHNPDEFFSSLLDLGGVNTFQFLFNSIVRLQRSGSSTLPTGMRSGMKLLLNRFERTGRLYDWYDFDFKHVGGTYSSPYNYTLLPLCLMNMFVMEKDLQLFSTALQGVDVIPYLAPLIDNEDVAMCALAAIFLRDYLLREYYDYRKLRLFVN